MEKKSCVTFQSIRFSLSFLQTFFRDFIFILLTLFPGAIFAWAVLFLPSVLAVWLKCPPQKKYAKAVKGMLYLLNKYDLRKSVFAAVWRNIENLEVFYFLKSHNLIEG